MYHHGQYVVNFALEQFCTVDDCNRVVDSVLPRHQLPTSGVKTNR